MKRLFLFLLLVCSRVALQAAVYPSFEEVVVKLYANYSVREMERGEDIQYQKKPDGWHIALLVYNDSTQEQDVQKEELYWSAKSGKYKALQMFPEGQTSYSDERVEADMRSGMYDFSRCPYYGYKGWDRDVIAAFANYKGRNDTIYEGLARAYGNYAQGYTNHHYAFHLAEQMKLPGQERVDLFIATQKKAIAVYDGIRKRNPHFEVLIGEVSTKYYNEIMATYDDLLYYGREGEMKEYFKEDFYSPFLLGIARNMLESCAPNGILFTGGDNDSYPLWYLQWIKGVRTDVAVMNSSLMNTDEYLTRFRNGFLKVPAVKMSIADSFYTKEGYFLKGETDGRVNVTGAQFFNGNIYRGKEDGQNYSYFKPCKIVVQRPKNSFAEYDLVENDESVQITMDSRYLMKSDMAMLDILLTNFETRPVYAVTSTLLPGCLEPYFFVEGLVRRFVPANAKSNSGAMNWTSPVGSTVVMQQNMLKLLAADTTCADRIDWDRWQINIKISALSAAQVLLEKDKEATLAMLRALYNFFPYKSSNLHPVDVYALDLYYAAGDEKAGDTFGTTLLNHIETQLSDFEKRKPLNEEEKDDQLREKGALLIAIDTFDKRRRAELSLRARTMMDRYD